jgi:predicted membrane protein
MRDDWRKSKRLFFAIFLIAAGTLLFLGNLGLLPVRDIWNYWPLVLIAVGVLKLWQMENMGAKILGIALTLFGAFFLLLNLNILHIRAHDQSWPIALLLIAFGTALLIKVFDPGASFKPAFGFAPRHTAGGENNLQDMVIFGSAKRKLDTADFRGGELVSVFGSIEIDLRRARIVSPQEPVTLDATAVFGQVKIRVPETWRVNVMGAAILGNYEDRTIPPNTGIDAPVLMITGASVFGSVEIED